MEAVAAAKIFPYDHRYRDLLPQMGVRGAQLNQIKLEDLEKLLGYAIDQDPQNLELWWNMAVVQYSLGRREVTMNILRHAHEMAPSNPTINEALASANVASPSATLRQP